MNGFDLNFRSLHWRSILKFIIPAAIIIGWEVIAIAVNNPFILPRLESVIAVLLHPTADILGNGNLVDNAIISLERVISGFLVAVVIAIPLGIGMGRSEILHELFDSVMQLPASHPAACMGSACPCMVQDWSFIDGIHHRNGCIFPHTFKHP